GVQQARGADDGGLPALEPVRPPTERQRDDQPDHSRHQGEPDVADRQRDDAVEVRRDPVHAAVLASFAPPTASITSGSDAVPISAPDSSVTTQRLLGLDSAEFSRSRSGSLRDAEVALRFTSLSSTRSPLTLSVSTQPIGTLFSSTTRTQRPFAATAET